MIPETLLKVIISYGALGVCLAIFIWFYVAEKAAHTKTRAENLTALDTLLKEHTAELKKAYARLESEKSRLLTDGAAQERALLEQINELREAHAIRERSCLQTVEYFSKAQVQAVEELSKIAEVLRRNYERPRR